MNKGLKNKGLGSWFCLAAALVALITGIVFLSTQATAAPLGHSGTMPGVVQMCIRDRRRSWSVRRHAQ